MRRILMIATGGTIACKRTKTGLVPLLTSKEILRYVPAIRSFCSVDTLQILNLDSTNLRPDHWLLMASTIRDRYEDYDGFVLCHGTDTMAYTSAALSYLIQNSAKPIVITGAQKPIDMEITDAKTNLQDSFRYASCPQAHGVVIVFDGKVICGTRARKMRTKSNNAFSSINFPDLAVIQEDRIIQYIQDPPPNSQPIFYQTLNPNVIVIKLIPGMDPHIFCCLSESFDGVIIESYGVGGIPWDTEYNFASALDRLVQDGKIVVMTTQVLHEGSDMSVYQVGHMAKKQFRLMESYDMTLESTVTKLMWALGQSSDPKEVRRLFNATINHDMLYQGVNCQQEEKEGAT